MMPAQDAWIRAEMGGTRQALVITKPDVLIALIKRAKRPLVIIGHETLTDSFRTEVIIRLVSVLHETLNIPVICTSHIAGQLMSRGLRVTGVYGSMEILDRLRDPTWEGLDGNGQYDLVCIAGFSYSLGSLLFSGLKQNAPQTKIISLDPKYHPHAHWSYGNMKNDAWKEETERLIDRIQSGNTHQGEERAHV